MNDPALVKAFGAKLLGIYTGGVLTKLIDIVYQTGLFEASRSGAATSQELADRGALKERYVREWLGGGMWFSPATRLVNGRFGGTADSQPEHGSMSAVGGS